MSLQAFLIATWLSVEAIYSCPVCKETTDETFQHFIALHLQKTKYDIKKTLEFRDVENIVSFARQFQVKI